MNYFKIIVPFILPLILIVIWEFGLRLNWLPSVLIAPPRDVIETGLLMLGDGSLLAHSMISLKRLLIGFTLGSTCGLMLGALIGTFKTARSLVAPTVSFLAPVPVTAWIPLIIIFAGIGESSKSSILAVGAFFPVYFATIAGISMSDSKLVEVARLHGKSKLQVLKTVLFPCSIPYVFQGLKAALGLSWVLLIVAEVIASRAGLGWLMWDARNFGRPDEMIVGMITAGVLGASTAYILSRIERFALYWKPKYTGDR